MEQWTNVIDRIIFRDGCTEKYVKKHGRGRGGVYKGSEENKTEKQSTDALVELIIY